MWGDLKSLTQKPIGRIIRRTPCEARLSQKRNKEIEFSMRMKHSHAKTYEKAKSTFLRIHFS